VSAEVRAVSAVRLKPGWSPLWRWPYSGGTCSGILQEVFSAQASSAPPSVVRSVPAMGTRVYNLTIRVYMGGVPLFNRVVAFHHRTREVAVGTVHLVYRVLRLDWWSLPIDPGEMGEEHVDDYYRQDIVGQLAPGDSDAELTSEDEAPGRLEMN
jgi:hypothetical protein